MPYLNHVDVHLLLVRDDQIFLARRANTGYADGLWNLPSGKLDPGEDLIAAVMREANEEVGLELERPAMQLATVVHKHAPDGPARVGTFFLATRWVGEPRNAEPHKCSEIAWFPIDELPDDVVPYSRAGIEQWRRGESFGLLDWPHHRLATGAA
ncbi:NUDIX hydrolase [Nocardia terpenica]|uniref:DNA mismatch repair protein MutT n=1 Tax=Nocardia terpenica TaxID=455432 RepID=A0A164LDY1_9NOCA|nr:NUDIX domain-containing protein [Nocardia terpenica]KZM72303.1 DNA mismatch repair protein MutT [Nocardia terpenica]NQE86624.1 NUDIX domain-containing protein [Nocardia terpenica]